MEFPRLENQPFIHAPFSSTIWQAADHPHPDVKSSLASAGSTEYGCCCQILHFLIELFNWIASFFCPVVLDENLQGVIKEFVDQTIDQEKNGYYFVEEGPIKLLEDVIVFSITPFDTGSQFPTVLSLSVYAVKTHASELEGNKVADFYRCIGGDLLKTGKFDETKVLQKFELPGITDRIKTQLRWMVQGYNERVEDDAAKFQRYYEDLVNRFNSEEEESRNFEGQGPLIRVARLIMEYGNKKKVGECPNDLCLNIHLIKTHPSQFTRPKLRDFYLSIGEDLLMTGKLSEKLILEQCTLDKKDKKKLLKIIHDFNKS